MMTPTVHLNGTSGTELLSQNRAVADAIRSTLEALRIASPHGRDYYVQGPSATQTAIEESLARHLVLIDLLEEIDQIGLAIVDQIRTTK